MKMKINFFYLFKKFRSASNEDANQFLILKNSDLHLMKMQIIFWFEKNSNLHLMKMQISFWFEKNSDLHLIKMQISFLMKMQISFLIEKRYDYKQIFETKK